MPAQGAVQPVETFVLSRRSPLLQSLVADASASQQAVELARIEQSQQLKRENLRTQAVLSAACP